MLSLLAKLGLDVSPFTRGLDAAKGAAKRAGDDIASTFGSGLKETIFGAVSGAAIAGFGQQLLAEAGRLNDLSEQFGLTVAETQSLVAATAESGLEFEKLGAVLDRLGGARKDAAKGNDDLIATFGRFGVTLRDLQNPGKTNLDLLRQIGAALQSITVTPETREALSEIVGDKGKRLLEFIRNINEIKPLSLVTPEQVGVLDKFGERLEIITRQLKEIAAARLAEAITAGDKAGEGMQPGFARGAKGVLAFFGTLLGETRGNEDLRTQPLTAEDVSKAREALTTGDDLFSPDGKTKSSSSGRAVRTLSAASAVQAGNLAQVGLFAGGPGAGLYREARQQTELQRQTVAAIKDVRRAIIEEL